MSIVSKFLPAIALAASLSPLAAVAALSPLAAAASSMPQPGPAQVYMAPMYHQDPIAPSSATIDNPTRVYSNHAFPDSFGG
jgi:hypothetical protein